MDKKSEINIARVSYLIFWISAIVILIMFLLLLASMIFSYMESYIITFFWIIDFFGILMIICSLVFYTIYRKYREEFDE